MAIYEVEAPNGRKFRIESDSAPTEQELEEVFSFFEQQSPVETPQANQQKESFLDKLKNIGLERRKRIEERRALNKERDAYFGNKFLSGMTLGATDWAREKLGQDVEGQYKEYEKNHPEAKTLGYVAEFAPMLIPSSLIYKGGAKVAGKLATKAEKAEKAVEKMKGVDASAKEIAKATKEAKVLKNAERISKAAFIPATGAIEGAITGGFTTDSLDGALYGAQTGGILGGIIGGAGGIYSKITNIAKRTRGIERGGINVVQSDKGVALLDKGIQSSPEVARTFREQAPTIYEQLNKKAIDETTTLFGKGKTKSVVEAAKKEHGEFLAKEGQKQIFELPRKSLGKSFKDMTTNELATMQMKDPKKYEAFIKGQIKGGVSKKPQRLSDLLGLENLSSNQRKWLDDAWHEGLASLPENVAKNKGSLAHIELVNQKLNDLITSSITKDGFTSKSVEMMQLKQKFWDSVAKMGDKSAKAANKKYADAMRINDAYEMGLKYSSTSYKGIKAEDILSKYSPAEKKAFVEGVVQKATAVGGIKSSAESILKSMRALDLLDETKAGVLSRKLNKIAEAQDNVKKLDKLSLDKLQNRKTASILTQKPLNVIERSVLGHKYSKAGEYLLNPKMQFAEPNLIRYYNLGITGTTALNRELANEEVR